MKVKCINILKFIIPIVTIMYLITSCKQDEFTLNYQHDFFPLKQGFWVIYDVDSIQYNTIIPGKRSVKKYQLKQIIGESFIDNAGRTAYRVEQYRRNADSLPWVIEDIGYALLTTDSSSLEVVEDNLRFIKLIFPPAKDKTWLGNQYINPNYEDSTYYLEGWEYKYIDTVVSKSINGISFPATLTVLQNEDTTDNVIEMSYAFETYAKGVGLVEKELWHVGTQNISGEPWEKKAEWGFILKMKVREYKQ